MSFNFSWECTGPLWVEEPADYSAGSGYSPRQLELHASRNTLKDLDYDHTAEQLWNQVVKMVRVAGAIPVTYKLSPPMVSEDYKIFPLYQITMSTTVPAAVAHDLDLGLWKAPCPEGSPTPISGTMLLPSEMHLRGEMNMIQFIREKTKELYMHELDEQFRVTREGVETRPFDPHAPISFTIKMTV